MQETKGNFSRELGSWRGAWFLEILVGKLQEWPQERFKCHINTMFGLETCSWIWDWLLEVLVGNLQEWLEPRPKWKLTLLLQAKLFLLWYWWCSSLIRSSMHYKLETWWGMIMVTLCSN